MNGTGSKFWTGMILGIIGMLIMLFMVPIIRDLATDITVENALNILEREGYVAYSNPAGELVTKGVMPEEDVTYDLGTPLKRWRDLYLSGSSLKFGDHTITSDATKVIFDKGVKIAEEVQAKGLVLDVLTADPTMAEGKIWFRSDLNKVSFSPDGTTTVRVPNVHKIIIPLRITYSPIGSTTSTTPKSVNQTWAPAFALGDLLSGYSVKSAVGRIRYSFWTSDTAVPAEAQAEFYTATVQVLGTLQSTTSTTAVNITETVALDPANLGNGLLSSGVRLRTTGVATAYCQIHWAVLEIEVY